MNYELPKPAGAPNGYGSPGGSPDAARGPTTDFGLKLADLIRENGIRSHRELAERLRAGRGKFPSTSLVQAVYRGTKPASEPFVKRIFASFNVDSEEQEVWRNLAGLDLEQEEGKLEAQREAKEQAARLAYELRRLLTKEGPWNPVYYQADGLAQIRDKYGEQAIKNDPSVYPTVSPSDWTQADVDRQLHFFEECVRRDQNWPACDAWLFPPPSPPPATRRRFRTKP